MKKFLAFLSVLLFVGLATQGCQDNVNAPDNSPQAAAFDPDNDDAVVGKAVAGERCYGKIGNFVWADHDCDGFQDCHRGNPPEMGIAGVEVRLYDAVTGGLLATTYTDSTGRYKFIRLCYGSYLVEVVPPAGYVLTTPNAVTDTTKDSNPNPSLVVISEKNLIDKSIDFGFCMREGGDEGCTPGYWKQDQHFDSWPAPYTPDMLFSDVFEDAFPGQTLLDVVSNGGGGLEALGRHTVAAMLNGASDGVNYEFTDEEVISMFNDLFPGSEEDYEALKNTFEYNNELGCPLD
jgi:hypothetical protein